MALKFLNDGYFAGKVGIGTESPAARLHINPTTPNEIAIAINGTQDYSAGQFQRIAAGDANSINRLSIGFGYDNPTDWAIRYSSYGRHEFYTGNDWGNAANTEKMVITSAGNVGIGTGSPTNKLDIRQSTSGGSDVLGTGAITIGSDNPYWTIRGTATSLQDLAFDRRYAGSWVESMRIERSTGNVGIGTDNPLAKVAILTSGTFVLNSNGNDYSGVNIQMKTTNTAVNAIGSGIVWNKGASSRKVAAITNYIYGDADQSGLNFYVQPTSSGSSAVLTEAMRITNTGGISFGSTGTAYGTSGQILKSNGNASPTWIDGSAIPGVPSGSGTLNTVAMWTPDGDTLGNSNITQSTSFANDIIIPQYVRHTSDTNTYFGFGLNDTVNFGTAGSERMRITSDGNVGIGTTNVDGRFEVTQSATNSAPTLIVNNGSQGSNGFTFQSWRYIESTSAFRLDLKQRVSAGIVKYAFDMVNNGTGYNSTLVLDRGNVGIGTDSPGASLHVAGAIASAPTGTGVLMGMESNFAIVHLNGASGGIIDFSTSGVDRKGRILYNHASNYMEIQTNGSERMRIDSAGNVGIGTTLNLGRELLVKGEIAALDNTGTNDNQILMAINNTIGNLAVTYGSTGSYVPFQLETSGTPRFTVSTAGAIKFNAYDSTNNTGTPTYLLGTDGSGNIVKTLPQGSGTAGPYLPLAGGIMTGTIIQNGGNIDFSDGRSANFGNGDDLQIYHDAADSFIDNITGNLYIRNYGNDKDVYFQNDDGGGGLANYFYLDGGIAKTVFSRDAQFLDNAKALFGNSYDLQIYHDGSHSYISDTGTGDIFIKASNDVFIQGANGEFMAEFSENGSVDLYHNGSKKFETTSTGVTVTGDINIDSALVSNQENTDVDTGTETVASVAIATYTAAFFDFVIKKTTNVRSGTVYACHDGTNVEFTETSTQDLGDTSDVTLSVDISGGNMRLRATTTSDDWSVKSLIRAI
jgi:hypothetical protein